MPQIRVHEIAKELGVPAKVVIAYLASEGEHVGSAAVRLNHELAERVRTYLGAPTARELAAELNVPSLVVIDYLRLHGLDYSDPDKRLTAEMARRLRREFLPKKLVPIPERPRRQAAVDAGKVLWCPLCDWNATDSIATRQRMGLHLADEHYSEIALPPGKEPDDFEPA